MPTLRFGTCSWSEKSWVGPFYPPGTKPGAMLAHYATQFDTVEADSTYYASPPADRVPNWAAATPAGFILSSKLPRTCFVGEDVRALDADRVLRPEAFAGELTAYVATMQQLGDKLGPILIQCPWFAPAVFRDVAAFLGRLEPYLAALPAGPRWALEVRNRGWIHDELLALLRSRGVALAVVEVRGMPHPADVAQKHDLLTAPWFYARLIGDRSAVERKTKTLDAIVIDKRESLGRWAHLLRVMASSADGFVYANSHFAGYGPATIRELKQRIDDAGTPA